MKYLLLLFTTIQIIMVFGCKKEKDQKEVIDNDNYEMTNYIIAGEKRPMQWYFNKYKTPYNYVKGDHYSKCKYFIQFFNNGKDVLLIKDSWREEYSPYYGDWVTYYKRWSEIIEPNIISLAGPFNKGDTIDFSANWSKDDIIFVDAGIGFPIIWSNYLPVYLGIMYLPENSSDTIYGWIDNSYFPDSTIYSFNRRLDQIIK